MPKNAAPRKVEKWITSGQRANTKTAPFLLKDVYSAAVLHILHHAGAPAALPRSIACPQRFQLGPGRPCHNLNSCRAWFKLRVEAKFNDKERNAQLVRVK